MACATVRLRRINFPSSLPEGRGRLVSSLQDWLSNTTGSSGSFLLGTSHPCPFGAPTVSAVNFLPSHHVCHHHPFR